MHYKWCSLHGSYSTDDCYQCLTLATFTYCHIHGRIPGYLCQLCLDSAMESLVPSKINLTFGESMSQRKYLPTISDLLDRLTIVQQKELKIPEHRDEYTKELEDLMHDIAMCLHEQNTSSMRADEMAQMLRDVIVLTLMNCEIWYNESNFRKGIKEGNNLELTHGLNGIRNTAKNKIQEKFGGRRDFKIDNVKAFKEWVPSGYGAEDDSDEEYPLCENCGLEVHPNIPCEEVGGIDKRKK